MQEISAKQLDALPPTNSGDSTESSRRLLESASLETQSNSSRALAKPASRQESGELEMTNPYSTVQSPVSERSTSTSASATPSESARQAQTQPAESSSWFQRAGNWLSGAADVAGEVVKGAAQSVYTEVTEHPGRTLLHVAEGAAVGVAVVAAAPLAAALGAGAAVSGGIALGTEVAAAGLGIAGGVHAASDVVTAASNASSAASVLMHPDQHTSQELEAARKNVRDTTGAAAVDAAGAALGTVGGIGAGARAISAVTEMVGAGVKTASSIGEALTSRLPGSPEGPVSTPEVPLGSSAPKSTPDVVSTAPATAPTPEVTSNPTPTATTPTPEVTSNPTPTATTPTPEVTSNPTPTATTPTPEVTSNPTPTATTPTPEVTSNPTPTATTPTPEVVNSSTPSTQKSDAGAADSAKPSDASESSLKRAGSDKGSDSFSSYFSTSELQQLSDMRQTQQSLPVATLSHEQRTDLINSNYGDGAANKSKRLDIVMGPPGAGKSSLLVEPLQKQNGAMVVDADHIKPQIPGYMGGLGADAVHEESSQVAAALLKKGLQNGDNIVIPKLGKSVSSLEPLIDAAKSQGYEVHLHLADLSPESSARRTFNRAFPADGSVGQWVDPQFAFENAAKPANVFNQLINRPGYIDGFSHYNTDVPRGTAPTLVRANVKDAA